MPKFLSAVTLPAPLPLAEGGTAGATQAAARTGIGAVGDGGGTVLVVQVLTQAAYTALGTKVATTLYVIVG